MQTVTIRAPVSPGSPTDEDLELTLLMPCLDEARTVGACVEQARRFLDEQGIRGEVVVADNGSRDGSQQVARSRGARVVSVAERGYGAALAGGIRAARGRYIVMGDSDGSYDWSNVMPFLRLLRERHELVMGNRYRGGIRRGAMPFLHRYLGNPFLTAVGRRFFGSDCGDFYCGQRGFAREAALRMGLRSQGMEFALEMLVKAALLRMRVAEVPITLSPDGRDGPSHLRTWHDGWRSLRFFLLYSPRWLFLYPGLLLLGVGLLVGAWLLPGPRFVGSVKLDVHTLLYCSTAVSIGLQLAVFYLFAKAAAIVAGLHPPGGPAERMINDLRLEHGLIAGGLFVLGGLVGSVAATAGWAQTSFGDLDPFRVMRLAIPSVLWLTLGFQLICSSFYFNLLKAQWSQRSPLAESPR